MSENRKNSNDTTRVIDMIDKPMFPIQPPRPDFFSMVKQRFHLSGTHPWMLGHLFQKRCQLFKNKRSVFLQ